ncbi:L-type lectin family protein [Myroides fluvii]|uniref:hypothetical protein n=1 Tax=Myroides fluvii TaxID=2572594 RepID=UPI00131BFBC8|nr:hypothetical protein [Myroides fluvii]
MKTKIYYILGLYTLISFPFSVLYAQFPYHNQMISGDDFSPFSNSDKVDFKTYGAELTTKENQTKGFFLNDLVFANDRGFVLRFEYVMTGKGPGTPFGAGNGLALVLFDGSVDNPAMGASGSGIGYSYRKATSSGNAVNGLTKGMLSIGLDLYGDFKSRIINPEEFRNGIYTNGREGNHVTVRGQGDGLAGYPVLISQSVWDIGQRYQLDAETGAYSTTFDAPDNKGFSFKLRENERDNEMDSNVGFGHLSYRRVEVSMLPGKMNALSGFFLNVDIVHGSETSRVINSYFIQTNALLIYNEAQTNTVDALVMNHVVLPQTFRIGFIGATGSAYQKNIVRNISIYLPFSPSVKTVEVDQVCKDDATILDVLEHSVGFNSNLYSKGENLDDLGKKEYLDPYSFQFTTLVNGEFVKTTEPFIAVTSNGRYEYNPVTMQVEFVPKIGMVAKEDQVYFNIKNKKSIQGNTDLGGEQFRSNNAMIKLNFTYNCNDIIMVNGNSI